MISINMLPRVRVRVGPSVPQVMQCIFFPVFPVIAFTIKYTIKAAMARFITDTHVPLPMWCSPVVRFPRAARARVAQLGGGIKADSSANVICHEIRIAALAAALVLL